MDNNITATELGKNLSDVLNRVRYHGERFTVARNGEPVAIVGPASAAQRVTLRELAAQMGDVPLPDAGFGDDVDAMRQTLAGEEPPVWPT